jgi:UDP-glucuronate decarboxylase
MRVLVTGGVGFLGSHLARRLLLMGHEVVALDNFYTGKKENVYDLLDYREFEILRHDVTEPIKLEVDAIANLACPASPIHYQKYPVETTRTSVMGAINMLELARKLRIPILQASTSEVYGDPTQTPQKESYWGNVNPIGIRACYDEGKRVAETLFFDYFREHQVDIKVARIFNTYGPSMAFNDGRVVSNFIVQGLKNESITIYGDGSQTRSFCYVSDLIEAIVNLLFSNKHVVGPINIGNPTENTILELATRILKLTGSNATIDFRPLPQDDPKQRKPDISLANQQLSWAPKVNLDEGLTLTINDFVNRLKA